MNLSVHQSDVSQTPEFSVDRVEGELMAVNSYLVHGPDGIVVIDGQLTVSDATKVREAVDATGRELTGLLITHPHPDHYAGAALIAGDAPIFATPGVRDVIERDDEEKTAIVSAMMGEQWPAARRFPDQSVDPGGVVELAGLRFRVTEMGPGESHVDTLWWLGDRTVFVGDVIYHQMHAYLADAHHADWLAVLGNLRAQIPADAVVYPGHGEPADTSTLDAQRRYIEAFLAAVADYDGYDPQARQVAVTNRMRSLVSDERLLFLMELSVEPVHASLVRGRA